MYVGSDTRMCCFLVDQRNLGMSMKVERSTLEEVKSKLKELKKKKGKLKKPKKYCFLRKVEDIN